VAHDPQHVPGDQCTTPDGQTGQSYTIEQGVAQGCPMSPILFDICIDDLLE
jgi:hypothetical protein